MHYPNAPITEAIIELRVRRKLSAELSLLKNVGDAENRTYPNQEKMIEAVGQMKVGPGVEEASVKQEAIGWRLVSADGKRIAQSRSNGFAFSRLAPYESWLPFCAEARRLWTVYRQTVAPDEVERLAVRYLNRIDIPGTSIELKDFLRTSPEVAPELPQQLSGYFMQLRLPFPDIAGTCVINQTIVPPAKAGAVSLVLDVDLFRTQDVPQHEPDIWAVFEQLHQTKNHVFEACITDAARRLFS